MQDCQRPERWFMRWPFSWLGCRLDRLGSWLHRKQVDEIFNDAEAQRELFNRELFNDAVARRQRG